MFSKKTALFYLVITVTTTLFSFNSKSINEIKSSEKTSDVIAGKVLEKIDAGDNIIINLFDEIDSIFVLAPKNLQSNQIEKGDRLVISNLSFKKNYVVKFLSRNFKHLITAKSVINMKDLIIENNSTEAKHVHTADEPPHTEATSTISNPHKTSSTNPHQSSTNTSMDINVNKLSNGYTVEELYKNVDKLVDKVVKIRAKIVKYSPNILNSNWLHIQDGTGNSSDETNDLVVVTKEVFKLGDTVILKGKLAKDHDLGMGYLYKVIILDAVKIDK